MSYKPANDENHAIAQLKEELLAVQAANIALAAIISCLPETAKLDNTVVESTCAMMCDMDAHTEMVTSEFAASILSVAREIHKVSEEE